jgi:signal transduction histidine kinase
MTRLRGVCDDLLDLSTVAATSPERCPTDPAVAVAAARERLREGPDTSDADVEIEVRPLPAVLADPEQLERVFVHLLRLATRKAVRSGLVVRGAREGADVRLQIGPKRARSANGARQPGSIVGRGAALALSDHIAALNGGRVWVERDASAGATISLTLPAAPP